MSKRNVVLFHLESINELIYRMNPDFFPSLIEWERKSVYFQRYFSTATSTLMVLSDLSYENTKVFESCDRLCALPEVRYEGISLADEMKRNGYAVNIINYSCFNDVISGNYKNFVGKEVSVERCETFDALLKRVDSVTDEPPFFLWLCDTANNIEINHYIHTVLYDEKDARPNYLIREDGYRHINELVRCVMHILEEKGMLDNTTVFFYGDHGDDLFQHGWHRGLSHAVEPYATLIKTPMWVYDRRLAPGCFNDLIGTTEIGMLIRYMLNLSESIEMAAIPSIFNKQYIFSRNMYASQPLWGGVFNKGYSVTDGSFLLMASNNGLEMFYLPNDYCCIHNLLDYYNFDDGILTVSYETYDVNRRHFGSIYGAGDLERIKDVFYFLFDILKKEIQSAYHCGGHNQQIAEINLEHILYSRDAVYRREVCAWEFDDDFLFHIRYFKGKKVSLYGAGVSGRQWYKNLCKSIDIVTWVDRAWESIGELCGRRVESPDVLNPGNCDYVIITINDPKIRQDVKGLLKDKGFDRSQIY